MNIKVVKIGYKESILAVKYAAIYKGDPHGPSYFFRDALIAASAETFQYPLITNNINNFKGLPHNLKVTSLEAIKYLKSES